jgi:hypothetical protein
MKHFNTLFKLFSFLFLSFAFSSCLKNKCESKIAVTGYEPVYTAMSTLRTQVRVGAGKPVQKRGKIYIKDSYIFLNEVNEGIHIIDNSNPSQPINKAFIKIPGNLDMAVRGNILFADNYIDLLCFDISDPANVVLRKRNEAALPFRIYNYGLQDDSAKGIITSFVKKETIEVNECDPDLQKNGWLGRGGIIFFGNTIDVNSVLLKANGDGKAGSLARFALNNQFLYVVNRSSILSFDINNPLQPIAASRVNVNWDVETIYPFRNHLLIGSATGMYIFGLDNPATPNYKGSFIHWRGCDPVVAEGNYAYVTIRGGTVCGGVLNQVDVIDISDFNRPQPVKSYPLTGPYGLAIENNELFICDGVDGVKIFDATDKNNLRRTQTLSGITAYDIILQQNRMLVTTADGLYQYNITQRNAPVLLSKISIQK